MRDGLARKKSGAILGAANGSQERNGSQEGIAFPSECEVPPAALEGIPHEPERVVRRFNPLAAW